MKALTPQTRAILFDHDGTLIDSEQTHFELWRRIAENAGITLTSEFYDEVMVGIPVKQNARDLVAHFDLAVDASELARQKFDATRAFLAKQAFPLMPGAYEVLIACANAGYTLAVVTGGSAMSVQRTIEMHGLDGLFATVVAAEDVEHSKPAPDCYLKAMKQIGVTSDQAIAVEDTVHGMRAALAAGIKCVAIPGGQSDAHDFSQATVIYSSLSAWQRSELER